MNPSPAIPDDPLDEVVRDHLAREAESVDARAMLLRIQAGQQSNLTRSRSRWRDLFLPASILAIAATLLVAFFFGGGPEPQPLTAAELIREARDVHSDPADRCYAVIAEWDPAPFARMKLEPIVRTSRLWTRGDQFWISTTTSTGQEIAWGQDRDGRVWVAPNRSRGLIYEPDELGEPLTRYCDLMSLRMVSTLEDLLEQYDLSRRDETSGPNGEWVQIEATLRPTSGRPTPPRFRRVELEVDRTTKVIHSAVLKREWNGSTIGTLTFTLEETTDLPDDQYTLQGHLDPDASILDGKDGRRGRFDPRSRFRDEILKRLKFQAGERPTFRPPHHR